MTPERAQQIVEYIEATRPKKGPMMIKLSIDEIEDLCKTFLYAHAAARLILSQINETKEDTTS